MKSLREFLASNNSRLLLNREFSDSISDLHPSLETLINCQPFQFNMRPADLPSSAIYLFCDNDVPLYVGRTNNLRQRLAMHCRPSSTHNQAAFAFKLAREEFGVTERSYKGANTRKDLMEQPTFVNQFSNAKTRLRNMDIRYAEETDQLKQTLLEIYSVVALDTPYNEFGTH